MWLGRHLTLCREGKMTKRKTEMSLISVFFQTQDASIILMKYRAGATITNGSGETPLHIAARYHSFVELIFPSSKRNFSLSVESNPWLQLDCLGIALFWYVIGPVIARHFLNQSHLIRILHISWTLYPHDTQWKYHFIFISKDYNVTIVTSFIIIAK